MRKLFLILLPLAFLLSHNQSWGQQTVCHIETDNWQQLRVVFTTKGLNLSEVNIDGTPFSTLTPEGMIPSNEPGKPSLPLFSQLIEVPLCDAFEVELSSTRYDTLDLGTRRPLLAPVQPSRSKSDTLRHPLLMDSETYATDAFYQLPTALVEPVGVARDRRMARLQFSPVSYNPVSGQVVICREATMTVRYIGADARISLEEFERYHSPAFLCGTSALNNLYPKTVNTDTPVRYLIVAHSMFRGQLDTFVQWKRRKGFLTDIVYTDMPEVGTTNTSIQAYIRNQYNNATAATPAPTYLLLVGDHEQIPAFNTAIADEDHITDLYYTTWTTGDNIPDCYYGRFSAQNVAQLAPQIQKTLMYEQYTFADPSFLDRAVMVAGEDDGINYEYDNGYKYADPAMDYAITNYINGVHGFSQVHYFKNNTAIVPVGVTNVTVGENDYSESSTIRSYYNQGAGWINYSAHGNHDCWGTPELNTTQVASMTNTQKFGVMIGNCCKTNRFQVSNCLGEALLRKSNAGAVGYIGASNSSYWTEDFYWAVGLRYAIGPTMSMDYRASRLGAYDRLMHTHGEDHSQWAVTLGAIMHQGNMAVEGSSSNAKLYYWEIYHLMGDPSLMPYLTQADTMTVTVSSTIVCGTPTLSVTAVPYALVALVDTLTDRLVASSFANANGNALLLLPDTLTAGQYRLAVSAQQYRTSFVDISAVQPAGGYPLVTNVTSAPLRAGATLPLTLHLENYGTATAHQVVVHLTSGNPLLTLSADSVVLDSLTVGANLTATVNAYVADCAPDNSLVDLHCFTRWEGSTLQGASFASLKLLAPVVTLTFSHPNMSLQPGGTTSVTATLHNSGHAATSASPLTFTSPTSLLPLSLPISAPFALPPDSDTTVTLTIHADTLLPQYITIPVSCQYGTLATVWPVYIGPGFAEGFESGSVQLAGVSNNGNRPWVITNSQAYEGAYCMRSAPNMPMYGVSEMSVSVNVEEADSMSFYYRTSTEEIFGMICDFFYFIVDGDTLLKTGGETEWERAQYLLTSGQHTLKFRYEKDVSGDGGSDCVWIDNLVLPHLTRSALFRHDTLCAGSDYVLFGDTIDTRIAGNGDAQGIEDGIVTFVQYHIFPTYTFRDTVWSADSTYLWHDSLCAVPGVYERHYTTVTGCDSLYTLVLYLDTSTAEGIEAVDRRKMKLYQLDGNIVIELSGADGLAVSVLDIYGRPVVTGERIHHTRTVIPIPCTGLYIVTVEGLRPRKIVVLK